MNLSLLILSAFQDGKYTIRKLPITKLGGRDPETGRKVIGNVRGGSKQKYRWIDWKRLPDDWDRSKDLVEKVIAVKYDPMRDAKIMLTGYEEKLRWQIATSTIKVKKYPFANRETGQLHDFGIIRSPL